ncbi:hypothetical protein ACFVAJ_17895 [Agromyces sp. NPDC057679]|uniref:hypothetical protein n=1 Tax=Agromyces sp. NPDC057679 TaxID=3346207 RepID=UPI0036706DAB
MFASELAARFIEALEGENKEHGLLSQAEIIRIHRAAAETLGENGEVYGREYALEYTTPSGAVIRFADEEANGADLTIPIVQRAAERRMQKAADRGNHGHPEPIFFVASRVASDWRRITDSGHRVADAVSAVQA